MFKFLGDQSLGSFTGVTLHVQIHYSKSLTQLLCHNSRQRKTRREISKSERKRHRVQLAMGRQVCCRTRQGNYLTLAKHAVWQPFICLKNIFGRNFALTFLRALK
jgi:hypothetical protein